MGSISYHIPFGSSAKAEVAKYVRDSFRGEVVASNFAPGDHGGLKYGGWGGYYFAALRHPDGYVFAAIIAFGQDNGEVVIKAMDESMGPTAIGVGPKVLAELTPLPGGGSKWALEWREEARKYQERRNAALAATGKTIKLAKPMKFRSGLELDTFEVESISLWRWAGRRFRPGQNWFLSDWQVAS